MKTNQSRVEIFMPLALLEKLKSESKRMGISVSSIIKLCILEKFNVEAAQN